ncbi:MAG: hypothetical protein H6675_03625 [Dehalococcoidia bacterium]|nr:hypothetical protein [Dehalococcoidia bacterium]
MLFAEGVSVAQIWPYVFAVFLAGGTCTAVGITVAENDYLILAGMILTGVGVVSMWVPGKGALRPSTAGVLLAFVSGSVCTAISLTVNPSNPLLFAGMVLSSIGIAGMWLIGKESRFSRVVAACFVGGITLQATGLTAMPSDVLVMLGMVLVPSAVFGMWFEANRPSSGGQETEDSDGDDGDGGAGTGTGTATSSDADAA